MSSSLAQTSTPRQQPTTPAGPGRPKVTPRAREERRAAYGLIAPTFVIVLVMVVLPILWTFSMAFQRIRLLNLRSAGIFGDYTLANFRGIFTSAILLITL